MHEPRRTSDEHEVGVGTDTCVSAVACAVSREILEIVHSSAQRRPHPHPVYDQEDRVDSTRHTLTADHDSHPHSCPHSSVDPRGVASALSRRLPIEHKVGDIALPRPPVAKEDLPDVLEVRRARGGEGVGVWVLLA